MQKVFCGNDFYRRIINEAKAHLTEDGHILFEIGCFQAVRVSGLLHEAGFENIRVVKDLAGLDRVVMADVKWLHYSFIAGVIWSQINSITV